MADDDDDTVFGFGEIWMNDAKHKEEQRQKKEAAARAEKLKLKRERVQSLHVKSAAFEQKLSAKEQEQRDLLEKRKKETILADLSELKAANRKSMQLAETDANTIDVLPPEILGATAANAKWELSQASNPARGDAPPRSLPEPLDKDLARNLNPSTSEKIKRLTSVNNANDTLEQNGDAFSMGIKDRFHEAASVSKSSSVLEANKPRRIGFDDENAPIPKHVLMQQEKKVIDKANAWVKARQEEVPFEIRLAQQMSKNAIKST